MRPTNPAQLAPATVMSARLKRLRARLDLTQARLAVYLGVSVPTVNRWENGHSHPTPDTCRRIEQLERAENSPLNAIDGRASVPWEVAPSNLPIPLPEFVGRERELIEGSDLLQSHRALTLTGPGGCGKTRLALELARRALPDFDDGIYLVELHALDDPALVPQAVANGVQVSGNPPGSPTVALVERFRSARALLILDNCEHLLDACAKLVDELLARCPDLRVLATSREALGVGGETIWQVPPMSTPGLDEPRVPEQLLAYDAVQLFVDRVKGANPSFSLTTENAADIARICIILEGLPLALELAAARVRVLSLNEIVALLGDRFHLLSQGRRGAAPRHQSLRAALDWSYDLLDSSEQALFRRLAVFAGGWTLEALEDVGASSLVSRSAVLDLLHRLVDKSLVSALVTRHGTRYRLLETVREYARERLIEAGERDEVERRHADSCRRLAERANEHLFGPRQAVWLDRLEGEKDNLRAALQYFEAYHDDEARLSTAASLYRFWTIRGYLQEGMAVFSGALGRRGGASIAVQAAALRGASVVARELGDHATALAWAVEHCRLCEATGDSRGVGWALANRAVVELSEQTLALLGRAGDLFDAEGDDLGVGWSLGYRGLFNRDPADCQLLFEQGLRHLRAVGDLFGVAWACTRLAVCLMTQGKTEVAASRLEEASELAGVLGARYLQAAQLKILGDLLQSNENAGAWIPRGDAPPVDLRHFKFEVLPNTQAGYLNSGGVGGLVDRLESQSLTIRRSFGDALGMAASLVDVGIRCANRGDLEPAVQLLACGGPFCLARNPILNQSTQMRATRWEYDRAVTKARIELGEARFHQLWLRGAATPLAEAARWASELVTASNIVGWSLVPDDSRPAESMPVVGSAAARVPILTRREREVLRLVARGHTNAEIGRDLVLSTRTVERHLANIFAKTRTQRREAAVAFARERELL